MLYFCARKREGYNRPFQYDSLLLQNLAAGQGEARKFELAHRQRAVHENPRRICHDARIPHSRARTYLRAFAGLSFEDIGDLLQVSRSTTQRDFDTARAYLLSLHG